jgi:hypothetical protein
MMRKYRVTVQADFAIKAEDPSSVRRKLSRLLKSEGFEDKSFEIGIERDKVGVEQIEPAMASVDQVVEPASAPALKLKLKSKSPRGKRIKSASRAR